MDGITGPELMFAQRGMLSWRSRHIWSDTPQQASWSGTVVHACACVYFCRASKLKMMQSASQGGSSPAIQMMWMSWAARRRPVPPKKTPASIGETAGYAKDIRLALAKKPAAASHVISPEGLLVSAVSTDVSLGKSKSWAKTQGQPGGNVLAWMLREQ